jgi:methylmalonyl-CoA mutase cobalamin-binding subunit
MCISKNARARPGAAAEERTLGDSGMEVVVRGSGSTLAVAQVQRAGTLSNVSVLVHSSVSGDRSAFARALVAGC